METRRFGKRIPLPSTRAIKHQIRCLQIQEEVEQLNVKVSAGIYIAEHVIDQGSAEAHNAYAAVSALEEEIANLTTATSVEGAVARRGAVRAAVKATDIDRAKLLIVKFSAGEDSSLREELQALLS